jgi:hypothetical protein
MKRKTVHVVGKKLSIMSIDDKRNSLPKQNLFIGNLDEEESNKP